MLFSCAKKKIEEVRYPFSEKLNAHYLGKDEKPTKCRNQILSNVVTFYMNKNGA